MYKIQPSDRARVSVGESESLFASPSSLASGSTGGDEFSAGVGSLICVEDPKLVCGGVIANSIGRRFCTRFNCTVKAHRTQKVILKADTLHVRGRKDQARLEPNLLISKLPGDVSIESIVCLLYTSDVAVEEVCVVLVCHCLSLYHKYTAHCVHCVSSYTRILHNSLLIVTRHQNLT